MRVLMVLIALVLSVSGCAQLNKQTASGKAETWLRAQPWVAEASVTSSSGPVPLPGSAHLNATITAKPGTSLTDLAAFRTAAERYDEEQTGVTGLSARVIFDDNELLISGDPAVNDLTFGLFVQARGVAEGGSIKVTSEHDGSAVDLVTGSANVLPAAEKLSAANPLNGERNLLIEVRDAKQTTVTTRRGRQAALASLGRALSQADPRAFTINDAYANQPSTLTIVVDSGIVAAFTRLRADNPTLALQVQAGRLALTGSGQGVDEATLQRLVPLSRTAGVELVVRDDDTVNVVAANPAGLSSAARAIGANAAAIGGRVRLGYGTVQEVVLTGTPAEVAITGALAGPLLGTNDNTQVSAEGRKLTVRVIGVRDDQWVPVFRTLRATDWPGEVEFDFDAGQVYTVSFTSTARGRATQVIVEDQLAATNSAGVSAAEVIVRAWNETAP